MAYAVELHFDAESTLAIAAVSQQLYTTCGGVDLVSAGGAPHVSLALFAELDYAPLLPLLATFAQQTTAFPISFAAVGTFPGQQGVVYLAPVVTQALLALHADFHARLLRAGLTSTLLYLPDRWVPHCTVGFGLSLPMVSPAVALCRLAPWPQQVYVTALRLIRFSAMTVGSAGEPAPSRHQVDSLAHYPLAAAALA